MSSPGPTTQLVIVRHSARLDTCDKSWNHSSATPYDTPLSEQGVKQAISTGQKLASILSDRSGGDGDPVSAGAKVDDKEDNHDIYIHSSPFLRCAQTSTYLAQGLSGKVTLRLDSVFGEWLTPDYFTDYPPPPSDNHESLSASSGNWIDANIRSITTCSEYDKSWPLSRFGNSGEYGETWSCMHNRFSSGLARLMSYYDNSKESSSTFNSKTVNRLKTIIIVTHGAGCNALLGYLSNQPLLSRIQLSSFVVARRRGDSWSIIHNSNSSNNEDGENGNKTPRLSGSSTSTSSSSMSDLHPMPPPSTNSQGIVYGANILPGLAPINNHSSPFSFSKNGDNRHQNNNQDQQQSFSNQSDAPLTFSFDTSLSAGSIAPLGKENERESNDFVYRFGGNQL